MRKTKVTKKKLLQYISIAAVVVFLISFALAILKIWESKHNKFAEINFDENYIEFQGNEYVIKENVDTFLIIGLDKFDIDDEFDSYNNNKQADYLSLVVIDNDLKKYDIIHINRDTMTSINVLGVAGNKVDTVTKQIALAHTYGNGRDVSCHNTADAVSQLLFDTKVNHYISVTMDAVPILNDIVGGVEVFVTDDFTGIDDTLIKGKTVTLRGDHALNFVRTRYGLEDSTNSTRMKRQQVYMEALYGKMQQCIANDNEFIVDASIRLSDYIVSDRSITQLQELAQKFNEYEFSSIRTISGESRMGEQFIEFYPDQDSIEKTVIDLFYELKD